MQSREDNQSGSHSKQTVGIPSGSYSLLNLNTLDALGLETGGGPLFDGLGARYKMRTQYFMAHGFKLYATNAASREALKMGLQSLIDMALPLTDNLVHAAAQASLSKHIFIVGVNDTTLPRAYAHGLAFILGDGHRVILINTCEINEIANTFAHEITHALTTSGNPRAAFDEASHAFKQRFCSAFSIDSLKNVNFQPKV